MCQFNLSLWKVERLLDERQDVTTLNIIEANVHLQMSPDIVILDILLWARWEERPYILVRIPERDLVRLHPQGAELCTDLATRMNEIEVWDGGLVLEAGTRGAPSGLVFFAE